MTDVVSKWLQISILISGFIKMANVVIVGAGLGGLPTAYELRHYLPREHGKQSGKVVAP
jgi:NADH dehydrogenase FAD-containing subunit